MGDSVVISGDYTGNYSRVSPSEQNRYLALLKEQEVPILDEDWNVLQDMLITAVRRLAYDSIGPNASPNAGFLIVGTGANNDFTITGGDGTVANAGAIYVGGLRLILPSNITYKTQEVPGPALTTPNADRTDQVYVDVHFVEFGPTQDASIENPSLSVETSRRNRLQYQVLVAEGAAAPANYTDANGQPHYIAVLATLNRTSSPLINAGMVVDARSLANSSGIASALIAIHNASAIAHAGVLAPLESPDFSGVPQAPTAAPGTNTPQLATCAFVVSENSGANHNVEMTVGSATAATGTIGSSGYSVDANGEISAKFTVQLADTGSNPRGAGVSVALPVAFPNFISSISWTNLSIFAGQGGAASNSLMAALTYEGQTDSSHVTLSAHNTGVTGTQCWFVVEIKGQ